MKQIVEKQGINPKLGGYDHLVVAGTYRIQREKRTNVSGYGIIARGSEGQEFVARTVGAACKAIRSDAMQFAAKILGQSASVLVVWRIES